MKLTETSTNMIVTRHLAVENGPTLTEPYGAKRNFRVDRVSIDYIWEGGAWVTPGSYSVSISGPTIKKDGGERVARVKAHPQYTDWSARRLSPEYEWTQRLVNFLRPQGTPSMLTLTDGFELEA